VKSFRAAKLRLATVLDARAREALARELASRVIAAAAPVPVLVVCDDEEVATWAAERGARVAWTPGLACRRRSWRESACWPTKASSWCASHTQTFLSPPDSLASARPAT